MQLSLEAAGTSASSYAFAAFHLGELSRASGQPRAAAHYYRNALDADPTYLPALAGQARLAVARGDLDAAERDYLRVVQRLPLTEYVVELGELYDATGRPELARQQYAVATATARLLAANGVVTDLETALFQADHGSPAEALAAARAEWSARHSIHTADALGWALHAAGRDRRGAALRAARHPARHPGRAAALPPRRRRVGPRAARRGRSPARRPAARRRHQPVPRGRDRRTARRCPMSRHALRLLAVAAAAVALVVGLPTAASAHPLGNFTVNRYSGVVVSTDAVTVDHVLDLAEIPSAQRSSSIDTDGDGSLARPELAEWAASQCVDAARSLQLTVGGTAAPLAVRTSDARSLPGQAGLPTLRLECDLRASTTITGTTAVRLVDRAADDEVGWREMTARGDGTTLLRSDAPERSRSARLTSYPQDLLSSPLDERTLRLSVRPGGPRLTGDAADGAGDAAGVPAGSLTRGADRLTLAFEGLLSRTEGNPLLGLVALLGALALGAAHAVAPGHGKTVMAFYLVRTPGGSAARRRDGRRDRDGDAHGRSAGTGTAGQRRDRRSCRPGSTRG